MRRKHFGQRPTWQLANEDDDDYDVSVDNDDNDDDDYVSVDNDDKDDNGDNDYNHDNWYDNDEQVLHSPQLDAHFDDDVVADVVDDDADDVVDGNDDVLDDDSDDNDVHNSIPIRRRSLKCTLSPLCTEMCTQAQFSTLHLQIPLCTQT